MEFLNTTDVVKAVEGDLRDQPELLAYLSGKKDYFTFFAGDYSKKNKLPLDYTSFLLHRFLRSALDAKEGREPLYMEEDWQDTPENAAAWVKSVDKEAAKKLKEEQQKRANERNEQLQKEQRASLLKKKWDKDGWVWEPFGFENRHWGLKWPQKTGYFFVSDDSAGGRDRQYVLSFHFNEKGKESITLSAFYSDDRRASFRTLSSAVERAYRYKALKLSEGVVL